MKFLTPQSRDFYLTFLWNVPRRWTSSKVCRRASVRSFCNRSSRDYLISMVYAVQPPLLLPPFTGRVKHEKNRGQELCSTRGWYIPILHFRSLAKQTPLFVSHLFSSSLTFWRHPNHSSHHLPFTLSIVLIALHHSKPTVVPFPTGRIVLREYLASSYLGPAARQQSCFCHYRGI